MASYNHSSDPIELQIEERGQYPAVYSAFLDPIEIYFGTKASYAPYLYIVDGGNNRIQVFDWNGNLQFTFGSLGSSNGLFNNPYGATVGESNYVYVTDTNNHRVQYFTYTGTYVGQWGTEGVDYNQLSSPLGIISDETFVYVADSNNSRIQVFTFDGDYVTTLGVGVLTTPTDLEVDAAYLYVFDTFDNQWYQIEKTWQSLGTYIQSTFSQIVPTLTADYCYNTIQQTFSQLESSITTIASSVATIDQTFSQFTCEITNGHYIDTTFSSLTSNITSLSGSITTIDSNFSSLTSNIISLFEGTNVIAQTFPYLTSQIVSASGAVTTIDQTFRSVTSQIVSVMGLVVDIVSTFKPLTGSITSYESSNLTTIAQTFSNFTSAIFSNEQMTEAFVKTLVLNTRTAALTHYENTNFNSFAVVDGRVFAASSSGMVELDNSNTDKTSAIDAYYQTGIQDLYTGTEDQLPVVKKLRDGYVVYESNVGGILALDLIEKNGQSVYTHDIVYEPDNRVKFGRGLRERQYSFKIKNVDGSDFIVYSFRVQTEAIQNRRR